MIGTEALARFEEAGYALTLTGEEIRASGPAAPSDELRTMVEEHRDGLKAAVLLEKPPKWLKLMLDRYVSEHVYVAARGQSFRVSLENVCANVAATIGLSPLEWERIRPEVEECVRRWKPPKKMEVLAYA